MATKTTKTKSVKSAKPVEPVETSEKVEPAKQVETVQDVLDSGEVMKLRPYQICHVIRVCIQGSGNREIIHFDTLDKKGRIRELKSRMKSAKKWMSVAEHLLNDAHNHVVSLEAMLEAEAQ